MNQQDEMDIDSILDTAKLADQTVIQGLPEAPAVSNIKVWIKGFGVMLTVRGEKMMDIVSKTETIVQYAESHGWKNTWDTPGQVQTPVVSQPTTPQQVSGPETVCSFHKTPMIWKTGVAKATGKSYAFWSCSQKNPDGSYCKAGPQK